MRLEEIALVLSFTASIIIGARPPGKSRDLLQNVAPPSMPPEADEMIFSSKDAKPNGFQCQDFSRIRPNPRPHRYMIPTEKTHLIRKIQSEYSSMYQSLKDLNDEIFQEYGKSESYHSILQIWKSMEAYYQELNLLKEKRIADEIPVLLKFKVPTLTISHFKNDEKTYPVNSETQFNQGLEIERALDTSTSERKKTGKNRPVSSSAQNLNDYSQKEIWGEPALITLRMVIIQGLRDCLEAVSFLETSPNTNYNLHYQIIKKTVEFEKCVLQPIVFLYKYKIIDFNDIKNHFLNKRTLEKIGDHSVGLFLKEEGMMFGKSVYMPDFEFLLNDRHTKYLKDLLIGLNQDQRKLVIYSGFCKFLSGFKTLVLQNRVPPSLGNMIEFFRKADLLHELNSFQKQTPNEKMEKFIKELVESFSFSRDNFHLQETNLKTMQNIHFLINFHILNFLNEFYHEVLYSNSYFDSQRNLESYQLKFNLIKLGLKFCFYSNDRSNNNLFLKNMINDDTLEKGKETQNQVHDLLLLAEKKSEYDQSMFSWLNSNPGSSEIIKLFKKNDFTYSKRINNWLMNIKH